MIVRVKIWSSTLHSTRFNSEEKKEFLYQERNKEEQVMTTANKLLKLPSSVGSSCWPRIEIGSVMNVDVISKISWGRVADIRTT